MSGNEVRLIGKQEIDEEDQINLWIAKRSSIYTGGGSSAPCTGIVSRGTTYKLQARSGNETAPATKS